MLVPKKGSVLQTNMHIGADPPCSFSLKCFESHVKFQVARMES